MEKKKKRHTFDTLSIDDNQILGLGIQNWPMAIPRCRWYDFFFNKNIQPMTSAPDDNSLSSNQDINWFLV